MHSSLNKSMNVNDRLVGVGLRTSNQRLQLDLGLLALLVVANVCRGADESDQSALYERAKVASIEVLVNGHLGGSGWIASADGYAFTAAHVVGNAKKVDVFTQGEREVAEVVAFDYGHDLALLRLRKRDKPYPHLPTAKGRVNVGQNIYLFGTPLWRHAVMFPGRVGRRDLAFEFIGDAAFYIETFYVVGDSPKGTSGGPWLNAAGEVVGLQSGMMLSGKAPAGLAFVTPASAIAKLLAAKKSAVTPTVGGAFEEIWEHQPKFIAKLPPRTEGLVMVALRKGGPLDQAKIQKDDVLLRVDGKRVRFRDDVLRILRSKKPGDVIELSYLRIGLLGSNTVKVKLGRLEPR